MNYPTNFNQVSDKELVLNDLMGFDFSSSQLSAKNNRAIGGKNFINENGVNKKRSGWNEVINFGGGNINGLWQFIDSGKAVHTICHCGTKIYSIANFEMQANSTVQNYTDLTTNNQNIISSRIKDARSFAVINNNRLYILCGDYLVYVKRGDNWNLERVYDNIDTYVPTTTISIDAENSNDKNSAELDEINMLSSKRINTLHVPSNISDNTAFENGITYYLDVPVIDNAEVTVEIQTLQAATSTMPPRIIYTTYKNKKTGDEWGVSLYAEGNEQTVYGIIDFDTAMLHFSSNSIFLPTFVSVEEDIDASDRVKVTFTRKSADYEQKVTKCTFGVLFGSYGATDRLFISGNDGCKNADFFSEINDFTYFSPFNTTVVGSDTLPIVGYLRLTDSTLAIFKSTSSSESTIYYRSGTPSLNDIVNILFPVRSGNSGIGAVNPYSNVNFCGDNIFLSENGVYGIVVGSNVVTDERITRERSRYINSKLCKENLSEVVSICHKNKLYMSVDGVCYIADARYKSREKEDMQDTFNYEWWYWENIPARIFCVFNNELYFGTKNGQICCFDEKTFTDRSYFRIPQGGVSINSINNAIVFNESLYFNIIERLLDEQSYKKDYICLKGGENEEVYISKVLADEITGISGGTIFVNTDININSRVRVGEKLRVKVNGTLINTEYDITDVNTDNNSFTLLNYSGEAESVEFVKDISKERLMLVADEQGNIKCQDFLMNEVKFVSPLAATFEAIVYLSDYVVSEWCTPIFNLGSSDFLKTLKSVTITAESSTQSLIKFGWEVRKHVSDSVRVKGANIFDFNNFSFVDFTFETSMFPKSYTKKVKEKNFNYIQFRILGDNDGNCAINNITINYVVTKKNKGVN